ncbi:MAG: class II D-tagatose-bisphosphate aldolase, non-catalytic subunit [Geminicoccaceae bacterium]
MILGDINARNRAGEPAAIPSVCSAHRDVVAASLLLARELERPVLVEATSNQVNQYGGYTGMLPADFIAFVRGIARSLEVPPELVIFGGDHLGPQVWRAEQADSAMGRAAELMRAYVEAGFTKIHLDCSEGCAGEGAQVDDEISARRSAELAAVCHRHAPDPSALVYVIGTEVPPPGGARASGEGQGIEPTRPERARHTLDCHRKAFADAGIADLWAQIVGLVVQPGLEFAATHLDHFDCSSPNELSHALSADPHICFEAHSTDYQAPAVFRELARRNFSVLKVGPALTFAYRQAVYALDHVRAVLDPSGDGTRVSGMMESLMISNDESWKKHYSGSEPELRLQRHFGYADRIRYYWHAPEAKAAVHDLLDHLSATTPVEPVLRQYFCDRTLELERELPEEAGDWPQRLILAEIQRALKPYFF